MSVLALCNSATPGFLVSYMPLAPCSSGKVSCSCNRASADRAEPSSIAVHPASQRCTFVATVCAILYSLLYTDTSLQQCACSYWPHRCVTLLIFCNLDFASLAP